MTLSKRKKQELIIPDITYKELFEGEKERVVPLLQGLDRHMMHSPIFMPVDLKNKEYRLSKYRVFAALALHL